MVDAWVNSYTEIIYEEENKDDWVVSDDITQIKLLKLAYHPKVDVQNFALQVLLFTSVGITL